MDRCRFFVMLMTTVHCSGHSNLSFNNAMVALMMTMIIMMMMMMMMMTMMMMMMKMMMMMMVMMMVWSCQSKELMIFCPGSDQDFC